mmetsp:Transcript_13976/g.39551  ORF Transcript_13976/g.39551 Transcript_13976/m.39551 type:complete len:319 (+) Transcript_13976:168-1124(+)
MARGQPSRLPLLLLLLLLSWTLSPLVATADPSTGELRILHLTDLHIDLKYTPGSEADCAKPPCCRPNKDPSVPVRTPASVVGEYSCDTRFQVLQSALDALKSELRPDAVVWTGDNAPHHPDTTKEEVLETIGYVAREIAQRLPGIPVFPSLGNYDFVPIHSDPGPPLNSWLLHPLAEMFAPWLDEDALGTFKYAGYYEAKLVDGLRVVALNTQMCHVKNLFQFVDNTNGHEQLAWLEGILKRSGPRFVSVQSCSAPYPKLLLSPIFCLLASSLSLFLLPSTSLFLFLLPSPSLWLLPLFPPPPLSSPASSSLSPYASL